jgi:hypothetical protein
MPERRRFRLFNLSRKKAKYDKAGHSQRRLCFDEFDNGKNWHEVAEEHGIKPNTCYRYYQTWKKLPEQFEQLYHDMIRLLKDPSGRNEVVKGISNKLNLMSEEVEQIMLRPWGLRSLLLACYGIKRIESKRSEKEKVALIRMERAIRKSGRSIEEIIRENEIVATLGDNILKIAREKIEKAR